MTTKSLNTKEPRSIPNNHRAVWDAVLADNLPLNLGEDIAALLIADIRERDAMGEKKHGTRLQPFNGRDWLVDCYQEALDLVCYARQGVMEEMYSHILRSAAERTYHAALQCAVDLRTALRVRDGR